MPINKIHIVSSWPGKIREAMDTLSIAKASTELAILLSKLDVRNVTVCSAVVSKHEILSDETRNPKLAYLFRPTDVITHREVFEKCTHVQLLIHEQDIIEGFFQNCIEYLKGKHVAFLCNDHAALFSRFGINGFGVVPIPTERFPDNVNTKTIGDMLKSLQRPKVVIMSNNSIRKNLYRGLLGVLDAVAKYGDWVDVEVIVNAGFSPEARNILNYYNPTNVTLTFTDTPSKKDMYYKVCTSTTLALPAIDEGFNMVLREMGRSGIDIICSDISVNRDYKLRNKDCEIIPMVERTIYPSSNDEIARPISLGMFSYNSYVNSIYNSICSWKETRDRMVKRFESPSILQDVNMGYGDLIGRFLSIPKKSERVGSGFINII